MQARLQADMEGVKALAIQEADEDPDLMIVAKSPLKREVDRRKEYFKMS